MSRSRTYIENRLKSNDNVIDTAKWHFHNKNSKKIWATLQWLNKNEYLSEKGLETYNLGYKGSNNILKISKDDLTEDGYKVLTKCYNQIGDGWDKVDTILSRCSKRL
jgi:hypothetical protein